MAHGPSVVCVLHGLDSIAVPDFSRILIDSWPACAEYPDHPQVELTSRQQQANYSRYKIANDVASRISKMTESSGVDRI